MKENRPLKGRPKNSRKISFMPAVSGFRPYGDRLGKGKKESVFLLCEEYEALRLNDYEGFSQCEAAASMEVSRPTFSRIYASARAKIAKAFVEGLCIVVEGGKVEPDEEWLECQHCHAVFYRTSAVVQVCALCGSEDVVAYAVEAESGVNEVAGKRQSSPADNAFSAEGLHLDTSSSRKLCCRRRQCAGKNRNEQ